MTKWFLSRAFEQMMFLKCFVQVKSELTAMPRVLMIMNRLNSMVVNGIFWFIQRSEREP